MDSSSDSEDCQLYTRAAQNIKKKREMFKAKIGSFDDVIHLPTVNNDSLEEIDKESFIDIALKDTNTNYEEELSGVKKTRPKRNLRSASKRQQKSTVTNKRGINAKATTSKRRRRNFDIPVPVSNCNIIPSEPVVSNVNNTSVIVLDDDTDFANYSFNPIEFNGDSSNKTRHSLSFGKDLSDDEDASVTISIEWSNGKLVTRKQFELRKYQKFETIFDQLASSEGLPTSRISLMRDYKNITPADTPDSLNLKYYAGLTGSISATDIDYTTLNVIDTDTHKNHEASITVKLKLESQKTLHFTIMKHQKMSVLYKKCSEELKCDEGVLKLTFDGDYIDPKEFLSSLDVEDSDIFNVYIKK